MKTKSILLTFLLAVLLCSAISVSAMTEAERQALIAQIQAQIAQLQAQLARMIQEQASGTASSWCHTFNTNIQRGDSGSEVANLQTALIREGFYIPSSELSSQVFNDFTFTAVVDFQEKYASEILTPLGLTRGTGRVASATRAKLNELYECETPIPITTCAPSWQCGSWSACIDNQQTKTCTDYNYCGTTTGRPPLTQSCTTVCTPSWQCTSWSACANNQQTRTCADSNSCGITTGRPALTQSCASTCSPDWDCTTWSACINSLHTRICTDANTCGTTTDKPAESESCTVVPAVDLKANDVDGPVNIFLTLGHGATDYVTQLLLSSTINLRWTGIQVASCVASETKTPSVFSGYVPVSGSKTPTLSGTISKVDFSSSGMVSTTYTVRCVSTTTGNEVIDSVTVNLFYTTDTTCAPNWQCNPWSSCVNSQKTRTCTDLNHCGLTAPSSMQTCPAVNLKANNSDGPLAISNNSSVVLSWTTSNVTSCEASSGWSGNKSTSGAESSQLLTSATTFTLTCTGSAGTASDSVVVNPSSTLTVDLKANNSDGPLTIPNNSSINLTWTTFNAASCAASSSNNSWLGSKNTSGSEIKGPLFTQAGSITYMFTCIGTGGNTLSDNIVVTVSGGSPTPTVDLKVNEPSIAYWFGTGPTLTWTSTSSTSCKASAVWQGYTGASTDWAGSKPLIGTQKVKLYNYAYADGEYNYYLTCIGPGGSATAVAKVYSNNYKCKGGFGVYGRQVGNISNCSGESVIYRYYCDLKSGLIFTCSILDPLGTGLLGATGRTCSGAGGNCFIPYGCTKSCTGKQCGDDDGCQGKCPGTCPSGQLCDTRCLNGTTPPCEGSMQQINRCFNVACSQDSDCTSSYNEGKGAYCYNAGLNSADLNVDTSGVGAGFNLYKDLSTFTCSTPGTLQSTCMLNTTTPQLIQLCPNGCTHTYQNYRYYNARCW